MSDQNEQLAVSTPRTVKEYLALPAYKDRFQEVLSERAQQFLSSLITLSSDRNLADCEPRSMIAGAMVAATLDFPLEKQLGLAHLVPYNQSYKDANGNWQKKKVAQFQMGYKGYIQLAHRSGQYAKMNARLVNKEAFLGYDDVGEPNIDWSKLDETLPAVGCVFAFKLVNGFTKVCYWSKEKIEAHAQKFSKAVQGKKSDSPWFTNPDAMWKKTVVMNELRAWGILSVQMASALKHDMAVVKEVGAEPEYIDSTIAPVDGIDGDPVPDRPAPKPRSPKGAAVVKENAAPKEVVINSETVATRGSTPNEDTRTVGAAAAMLPDDIPSYPAPQKTPPVDPNRKPGIAQSTKPANPLHAEGEKIIAETNAKAEAAKGAGLSGGGATANPAQTARVAATAQNPAPVQSFADAAKATTAAKPAAPKPAAQARSQLNAGEVITVEAQVEQFALTDGIKDGKEIKYMKARITSPEYVGEVSDMSKSPLWTLDDGLKLTLRGNGKRVFVDKVEALPAVPATVPDEF